MKLYLKGKWMFLNKFLILLYHQHQIQTVLATGNDTFLLGPYSQILECQVRVLFAYFELPSWDLISSFWNSKLGPYSQPLECQVRAFLATFEMPS